MRELTEHERQAMESALKRSTKLVAKGALSEPKADLDRLVMTWTKCSNWEALPEGSWLVKTDNTRQPYHVAEVTSETGDRKKLIIVGNNFYFDMGGVVAYSPFNKYES